MSRRTGPPGHQHHGILSKGLGAIGASASRAKRSGYRPESDISGLSPPSPSVPGVDETLVAPIVAA